MRFRTVVLSVVSVCLMGCGSAPPYEGPTRYPLKGKVTYAGEPVDGGSIAFLPQEDGKHVRPAGGPIVNGEYSVTAEQGAPEGTYRVEIRWLRPTGKQRDDEDTGEKVDIVKEALPAKFNDQSELTAAVGPDATEFDFELKP